MSLKTAVIQASELSRSSGKILRRVAVDKEYLIVEREGYPVAIIMPYEQPHSDNPLRDLVGVLGPEAERQGLTEARLAEELEASKRQVFEKQYGSVATYRRKSRKKKA